MSSKANRNRLSKEVRALVRASSKSTAELAGELGVSTTTIRRWQSRDNVADRSSRPKRVNTSLTPEQEQAIVALWTADHWTFRKLLTEVRVGIAPACSMGALCRCLRRNGLNGHAETAAFATHVPVRKCTPLSPNTARASGMLPGASSAVPRGARNSLSLFPSPPRIQSSSYPNSGSIPASSPSQITGNGSGTPNVPLGTTTPYGSDDLTHPSNWTTNTIGLFDPSLYPAFPASTLEKSIDYVFLNKIAPKHLGVIFEFLKGNGFSVEHDGFVIEPTWKFERQRSYRVGFRTEIHVYYDAPPPFNSTIWVMVARPTKCLLELMDEFFDGLGLAPRIRRLELSFDFHNSDPDSMWGFLLSHLYLRNQRSKAWFYRGTFYANNIRKSANGLRSYVKFRKKWFARLELVLNKGPVRQLGLKWLINGLECFDLRKHFTFMELDGDRIARTWGARPTPVTKPAQTLREKLASKMLQRAAESWFRRSTPPEEFGLLGQMKQVKHPENALSKHIRYLKEIPFNALFFDAVSKLKFLP